MTIKKFFAWTVGVLILLALTVYFNRIYLLTNMTGWLTDIKHPRETNHPVPWVVEPPTAALPPNERPPNIIVIMADDMGINDVTTYGGGYAESGAATPNIDSIASDGVRFDAGYAASAVCTVSRAAFMTGRYSSRFGVNFTPTPGNMLKMLPFLIKGGEPLLPIVTHEERAKDLKEFNELGMPPSEITVAELLKERGYHTMHLGKWHLGGTKELRPNNQGFDESLYMESGLYLPENSPDVVNSKQDFDPIDGFLWPNMRYAVSYNAGKWFEPKKYLTDYLTDEAVSAIRSNKYRPFFMYLAHWGVHTPLQAAKEDYNALSNIKDHRRRVYAAMVRSMDRSVGKVLQALKEEGLDQNTIVIFTSDNGAPNYIGLPEVNQPYRGWKLTFFEGGLRVPYMAKWPGHIAPGTRYKTPVSNIDILPTVVAAAGGKLPTDRVIDGVNLLPYLGMSDARDKPIQASRPIYWNDGSYQAMLFEGWKMQVADLPKKVWLYNLHEDPTERVNLADKRKDKVADLKAMLAAHNAKLPPSLWPSILESPIAIDKTLDQAPAKGDEYIYWQN